METVSLQSLHGGAVIDLFNEEFERVLANIQDENTNPKTARSITIKLEVKPDESRDNATTKISVTSKLAPIKPAESVVFFDVDGVKLELINTTQSNKRLTLVNKR